MPDETSLYKKTTLFPALWPLAILAIAYFVEWTIGSKVSEPIHAIIVIVATIFTYGALIFPLGSYLTFRLILMPLLRVVRKSFEIDSYRINALIVTGFIFAFLMLWKALSVSMFEAMVSSFGYALIATLNFLGHYWFDRLRQKQKNKEISVNPA